MPASSDQRADRQRSREDEDLGDGQDPGGVGPGGVDVAVERGRERLGGEQQHQQSCPAYERERRGRTLEIGTERDGSSGQRRTSRVSNGTVTAVDAKCSTSMNLYETP